MSDYIVTCTNPETGTGFSDRIRGKRSGKGAAIECIEGALNGWIQRGEVESDTEIQANTMTTEHTYTVGELVDFDSLVETENVESEATS
jgi:hypothetical protein